MAIISLPSLPEPKPEERSYVQGENIPYTLPNDAPEHIRLETQAAHLKAIMNNNVIHSPLSQPCRLLDVGCGTGIVTVELATKFPNAQVFGLDLTPVPQILGRSVPSNITYVQGNIIDLTPDDAGRVAILQGTFDLIFSRLLICGMPDWPGYIRKAMSLLNPGTGWLEVHDIHSAWYDEFDNLISADWEWNNIVHDAALERGLDFHCGQKAAGWMQDAGLVDVHTEVYRWYDFEDL